MSGFGGSVFPVGAFGGVDFARFFNSTPMAIASLDGSGTILRSNAAFVRLFGDALRARSVYAGVSEADQAALRAQVEILRTRREDR